MDGIFSVPSIMSIVIKEIRIMELTAVNQVHHNIL